MAKAKYWHKGAAIDFVNETAETIEANTIVALGTSRIGVAGMDIPAGETGTLVMEGVFKIPKGDAALTAGAAVYYNAESGVITVEQTDIPAGYAVQAADAAAAEAIVKLAG